MDYAAYLQAYNSGNHRELVREFCTDDVAFEAGSLKRVFRGKDEVLEFLLSLQDGVRDVLRAQVVLQDEDHIFAEGSARVSLRSPQKWRIPHHEGIRCLLPSGWQDLQVQDVTLASEFRSIRSAR